jgi:hypothetical protein
MLTVTINFNTDDMVVVKKKVFILPCSIRKSIGFVFFSSFKLKHPLGSFSFPFFFLCFYKELL